MDEPVEVVPGLHAGLAVFARRPDDVVRVVYAPGVRDRLLEMGRWASARGIPFTPAGDRELEHLTESPHHEGLCVVARRRPWASIQEVAEALGRDHGTALALDRVRNPYNIGAILRTAAFFGVGAAILGAPAPHPELAPTAVRVAEGGTEELTLARTTDLADTLRRLRARGVRVYGADAGGGVDASRFAFPRPALLVVGNEREGLSPRVRAECDALVAVRGTGRVESLNVAAAAALLIAAMTAATRPGSPGPAGR